MKVKLSEIKERLSLFCNDLNLTSEQRVEFSVLLEQVGKFKTGVLMIEEKTFRDYIIELLVFKFLRVKRNEIEEVENFVLNFFNLLFPEIDKQNIDITVIINGSEIHIQENTELTKELFNTVITTNII